MNETRELARFLSQLKYEDLPQQVIAKTKELILDQLGCELGASVQPWSQVIYKYVRDWGGMPESTIIYYGDKTKTENATFANSSFGHGFEIDDLNLPAQSHPGCIVVPAALAIGEREHANGRDFILAVVAGYEAMTRVNRAMVPSCSLRGFHAPSSITGPFGAATAAGKILGFDEGTMLMALAIAGSHGSGVMEYDHSGGSVKRMHAGMASHGGLRSAFLAQRGLTGPPTILEGEHGFCQAFSDEYSLEEITADLGEFKGVMETGVKVHCCCALIHTAIDAVGKQAKEHAIDPNSVAQIIMGTNKQSMAHVGAIYEPQDILSAQFSAPFSLALTLVKGGNGLNEYTEENMRDPQLLELAKGVRLAIDEEVQAEFPAKPAARITINLKDRTSYQTKVDYAKGSPQRPLSQQELDDKFRGLASLVLPQERVDQVIAMVSNMEGMGEISMLANVLTR